MTGSSKYDVGDKVYVVEPTATARTCDFCGGTNKVQIHGVNDATLTRCCPCCIEGQVVDEGWKVEEATVKSVKLTKTSGYPSRVEYYVAIGVMTRVLRSRDVFETKEAAERWIEKRRKKNDSNHH